MTEDGLLGNIRRRAQQMPIDDAKEYLAEILEGVFYRHEFARRNGKVVKASGEILECLGVPAARAEAFLSQEAPLCLTDVLIRRCDTPLRRTQLAKFLSEYRIIPVSSSNQPFLPPGVKDAGNEDVIQSYRIWNALLKFEYYALSVLGLDSPVMFPVVTLGRVECQGKTMWVGEHFNPRRYRYPLFVDFSVPAETSGAYMAMLGSGELQTDPPETPAERKLRKKRRKTKGSPLERFRWGYFTGYLEVYDLWKKITALPKADDGNARKRTITVSTDGTKVVRKQMLDKGKTPPQRENARRYFYTWKNLAKELVAGGYKRII